MTERYTPAQDTKVTIRVEYTVWLPKSASAADAAAVGEGLRFAWTSNPTAVPVTVIESGRSWTTTTFDYPNGRTGITLPVPAPESDGDGPDTPEGISGTPEDSDAPTPF